MLKKTNYLYEAEEYKIINPSQGIEQEILEQLNKYTDDKGNVDIENVELLLYLLKLLVESENEDYQFYKYTKENIKELEENPPEEYKTILYFLGNIISNVVINTYRAKILEVKQAHIELLQQEAEKRVNEFNSDLQTSAKNDKRISDERRISDMRKDIEPLQEIKVNPIKKLLFKLKK